MSLYHDIGRFQVLAWSVSGMETCIVVKDGNFKIGFDMGYAPDEAIFCDVFFISHGHTDHVSGIPSHARKRDLLKLPPATYYVPDYCVEPLRNITKSFGEMHCAGSDTVGKDLKVVAMRPGEDVTLAGGRTVSAFSTTHRVASLGFVVTRTIQKLRPEWVGRPSEEIRAAIADRREVHVRDIRVDMAYTGDTTFEVFHPQCAHPLLLQAELLITEVTYLENTEGMVRKARDYGHCHLREYMQAPHLFDSVAHLCFVHFSNKYPAGQIHQSMRRALPPPLRHKCFCFTDAKERAYTRL